MAGLFTEPLALGRFLIHNRAFVAPMAGVTDRPFRQLCKRLGADYAVGEMAASNALLWATEKTTRRINHDGEPSPKVVQIAGAEPAMMAEAAAFNIARGAEIIDINMGCPAKKVCNKAAGSALMREPETIRAILEAVLATARPSNTPVTLKIRTGWSRAQRNAIDIARMAEDLGVAMLTIHGRSREDRFTGEAEFETIAEVRARIRIPLVANGDIATPERAAEVLRATGADAVMVGRAGQGRPWIYGQIGHYLATGEHLPTPPLADLQQLLREHLADHYAFYGEDSGVRSARKHIGWYLKGLPGVKAFRETILTAQTIAAQQQAIDLFFEQHHRDPQEAADHALA